VDESVDVFNYEYFFFFLISTTVVKHTRRSQGTLKEKEKSIPKQGGMNELEVGMQLEVNLVAAQSAT
jgi:hypothetical protein